MLTRLVLFAVSGWALLALTRLLRTSGDTAERVAAEPGRRRRTPRRRFATTFATALLFFAGASLTAIAGDRAARVLHPDAEEEAALVVAEGAEAQAEAAPDEAALEEAAKESELALSDSAPEPDAEPFSLGSSAEPPPSEPAAAPEPDPAPAAEAAPAEAAPAEAAAAHAAEPAQAEEARPVTAAMSDSAAMAAPLVEESTAPLLTAAGNAPQTMQEHEHDLEPLDPEASTPGTAATVWLHRLLPDPTPPSRRLAPRFAKELLRTSRKQRVHWSLVLGTMRAEREANEAQRRMFSASRASVTQTAAGLAAVGGRKRDKAWTAVLSLRGDATVADRAVVLADYYRAVGLKALVKGLRSQEEKLVKRVLQDERITVYDGGRADLAEGRVDVRVVATVAFLAESFGQVTITSLISGHGLYSRPGVISAHIYGHAVDVAALDNKVVSPFTQGPGGLVEQAVRKLLLLPAEMRARQVISLLGLGGPSFPLANHDDHIHVGF